MGMMSILAVLTILATVDAPALNRDADGEADNLLFIIINAVVGVGSVAKIMLIKVEAPRDGKEEEPAAVAPDAGAAAAPGPPAAESA